MKTSTRRDPLTIGILGGGQLARMLALEAAPLGLRCAILSQHRDDPAAQVSGAWHCGDPTSPSDVLTFCQKVNLLTFESEFVPAEILRQLDRTKLKVFPSPRLMMHLQNRHSQKQLLVEHKIPTAKFLAVSTAKDLDQALNTLGLPLVLKQCHGGYDGNGTFHLKTEKDVATFLARLDQDFIAESWVPFQRELAVTLVRSKDGSLVTFPLVESKQTDNRCDWVYGPIKHKLALPLIRRLRRFLVKIDYVGSISFELFDLGDKLLVN